MRSADQQSKCDDLKDLPLETRIQFSHLQPNAFKFHACGTRREVRLPCGCVGESALPSDIRLAPITARMFDEYFTSGKPDRETYGGSLSLCALWNQSVFPYRDVMEYRRIQVIQA